LPFYPWLRRLTWERLVKLHDHHVQVGKRSVRREQVLDLPDDSALELAARLPVSDAGPGARLLRREAQERVRDALRRLRERDRELLTLRYLEQLSTRELAAVLGVSEGAVKVRHLRALERLRALSPRGA
jgi:RNA polymerase sigma-70 factor (ECF subfamily)